MRRSLSFATLCVVLTASSGASAGIPAVFGGLQPVLSSIEATVCPAPTGALRPLARILAADLAVPR